MFLGLVVEEAGRVCVGTGGWLDGFQWIDWLDGMGLTVWAGDWGDSNTAAGEARGSEELECHFVYVVFWVSRYGS